MGSSLAFWFHSLRVALPCYLYTGLHISRLHQLWLVDSGCYSNVRWGCLPIREQDKGDLQQRAEHCAIESSGCTCDHGGWHSCWMPFSVRFIFGSLALFHGWGTEPSIRGRYPPRVRRRAHNLCHIPLLSQER